MTTEVSDGAGSQPLSPPDRLNREPSRQPGYRYPVTSPDRATGAQADAPGGWRRSAPVAFVAGAAVGLLGGMIGLGGAEFRLPLLIGLFGFLALHAVILNKAMSLAVVITALPARLVAVPLAALTPHWPVVVNLLAGSLVGAWVGASWATRMRTATLHKSPRRPARADGRGPGLDPRHALRP